MLKGDVKPVHANDRDSYAAVSDYDIAMAHFREVSRRAHAGETEASRTLMLVQLASDTAADKQRDELAELRDQVKALRHEVSIDRLALIAVILWSIARFLLG